MPGTLTFFCELETPRLTALFADATLIPLLAAHGCGVAMAIIDLTPARAEIVRELTAAGVPVTAWLVLDPRDGYWLTLDNVAAARTRWRDLDAWAKANALRWTCVGLDIEAPQDDAIGLVDAPLLTLARIAWLRRSRSHWRAALDDLHDLVREIRAQVGEVESYQFPFIADERAAQSTLLQRVLGIADLRVDREVLMLYRSVLPDPWGGALIDTYGPHADAIAVGITGGGVEVLEAAFAARELDLASTLTELARARKHTDKLYVFSLEGCVNKGWLAALLRAPWPETVPTLPQVQNTWGRRLIQTLLTADRLVGHVRRITRTQLP